MTAAVKTEDFRAYYLDRSLVEALVGVLQDEVLELRVCRIEGAIYVDGNEVGLSLIANDQGVIEAAQLMAEGFRGAAKCVLPLPFGLGFANSQEDVRRVLGLTDETRTVLTVPPWDAYRSGRYRIHFQFDQSGKTIEMVSMSVLR